MSTLVQNKKVGLKYEMLDKVEAGIELLGFEVKSLREKRGSLDGAHISVRGGEVWLIGAHIPPYQPSNTPAEYEPTRVRKLLLHKDEIRKLQSAEAQKGLTIVPISMYTRGRTIKLELAVARGKKKYDKRETIKKKDTERDIRRDLKRHFNI